MIAIVIALFGFLVFREIQSYTERKRLTELLAAKDLTEYRTEPKEPSKRTNPLMEREKKRAMTGTNYGKPNA